MTYDYTEQKAAPSTDLLTRISELATAQRLAETKLEEADLEAKKCKEALRVIAEVQLPALMDEAGMAEFTTRDGIQVKVAETVRATIPAAFQAEAFGWLKANGHDQLIKREFKIEFSRDEESWAEKFERELREREQPLKFEVKRSIHPSTLASFVREQLEEGVAIPLDAFGVHRQKASKIKVKT